MNERELEKYRRQLQSMARQVATDAATVAEETFAPSGGQLAGELSDAPTHLGDRGTEEYLAEMNSTLLENEQYLVTELRAALQRIDAGTFGQCENCGQPIPKVRLDAIPYARFCLRCAEKEQRTKS
jgi:RNA polymerase-binding transcription factor DksA